ncbi:SDR family NAD(P)-dependent oxidoreductase [Roseicyclus sp.]|uniref:SDR family NAD(P)-dependent oxidoreductase n=1 Tax=Roseicyclus sp. TaxID=1914329 RepID=UPI003F9FC482
MDPLGSDLVGLRVLVTGAATGIGHEVARAFADAGAVVAVTDISARIDEAALTTGAACAFRGDVASEADAARIVAGAVASVGGLDCLVNVAGLQIVGAAEEMRADDWDRLMAVNLRGPFLMCRAAIPHLRRSSRGAIINTASVAGQRGGPGSTAYSASKGGLIAFGTALALELAPDGITVNTICPGWVDTGFNAPVIRLMGGREAHARIVAEGVPLGRQGTPADIAPAYLFLASSGARYVTAKAIGVDGGLYN